MILTAKHRKLLDDCLWELGNTVWTEKELIYCITELIKLYQQRNMRTKKNVIEEIKDGLKEKQNGS